MTLPFTLPSFTWSVSARFELQGGGKCNEWALPFGLSWGQCDFNHATCITFQFLCAHITLMVYKKP